MLKDYTDKLIPIIKENGLLTPLIVRRKER